MFNEVADWLREAEGVVILTGAGLSTESGIPDFRGPQGVWTLDPEAQEASDIRYYMTDPAVRKRSWQARLVHPAFDAKPNDGHRAIADLERAGRLDTLITQNIDGLHQAAGSSGGRTVEIHGTIHEAICMSCGRRGPMQATLDRVRAGEQDPPCLVCKGILKSATISFGQALVPEDIDRCFEAASSCDLFISAGTSLSVYPVAHLPVVAKQNGARLVIVNAETTPLDYEADAVFRDPAGAVLAKIAAHTANM